MATSFGLGYGRETEYMMVRNKNISKVFFAVLTLVTDVSCVTELRETY